MRKSQSRTGIRLVRSGVAVAATAAAVVAGTANPAFASDLAFTSVSGTPMVVGAGGTFTGTVTGLTTGVATVFGRLVTGSDNTVSCPAAYGTAVSSGPNIAVTAAKVSGNDNSATFTIPATTPPGSYRACLYAGNAANSALEGHAADNQDLVITPAAAVAAPNTSGPNVTSVTATGTTAWLSLGTTAAATFVASGTSCPTTYGTGGAITATTTKNAANTIATVTIPAGLVMGNSYNVCVFAGNTVGTSPLVGTTAFSNVPGAMVSPNVGPDTNGNTVVVSSPNNFLTNAHTALGAIFTVDPCPNVYDTTPAGNFDSATVTKVTNNRISVLVPAEVNIVGSDPATAYNLCIYGDNTEDTGTLATQPLVYSVATAVTVDASTPIDVTSGPSQGGQLVSITGTGFPTAPESQVSAAIGGTPLKDVRVISSTKLTGITQPRAAGAAAVSVTTMAGTATTANTPYTYNFGISVSPNTAKPGNTSTPMIYVNGAGFSNISFGSDADYNTAFGRVFLVTNGWFASTDTGGPFGTTDPITACTGAVVVVSDTELLCRLDLGNTFGATAGDLDQAADVSPGSYQVAVIRDASSVDAALTDFSQIASGSAFTVAAY
ncbi:hypothetical protein Q0Z83_105160 [Actinoplanes sichuanensis]|uniref:IPT/TIG domain-containing protein n=1 Tax=Actinoplanes sichuanensis TaxID=512349 RepID=A0ABW4AHQ0_9ACTN|nr:IPT/TIG domain-containing protein [Actinoplanes sichuanensis]BEL12325.1 hypothetical protein Q0Z83_105160 [Actinoplanes sichuanensis]